ncbi:MAG: aminoacetone oxidase family FAD-binding enzyme [Bacteroidales bacterium]|nr:aminoacetone oxidase family FAD-binding enzyme [Bacteroidales bacterium]
MGQERTGTPRIAVIGGGAAGCFCAVEARRRLPDAQVRVYEAAAQPMRKLALTGGGRCNLTNSFAGVEKLADVYPRGEQVMRRALRTFSPEDCCRWFRQAGVALVTQTDQCVFPESQDAMQIVRTLAHLMRENGVQLKTEAQVTALSPQAQGGYLLHFADGTEAAADKVVVTTGGGALRLLGPLQLALEPPVPSLFTLKIPDASLHALMGTVVPEASLRLAGTHFRSTGALLLTDWGVSGPATLKLSSYAARHLAQAQYRARLLIAWLPAREQEVLSWVEAARKSPRQFAGLRPGNLTGRLWQHILQRAGLQAEARWVGLSDKGARRLAAVLTADEYPIAGRARFKEEFVTCGGVSLQEIHPATLEARRFPGLFFAGEVLDIDAVTGGFNLQAAWSTGYVAAKNL